MALTAGRWYTSITLKDTGGKSSVLRYEQSAPADDAAARAASLALVTDLVAVTNAKVFAYHTYQVFEDDAWTLPAAPAEVEMKAAIAVGVENYPTKTAVLYIPAPKDGIFVGASGSNYDIVDNTDADLIAYLANFDSEALFYVSDGEQMDGFKSGQRIHVKSRHG